MTQKAGAILCWLERLRSAFCAADPCHYVFKKEHILIITILIVWLIVGALFGWPRARARYYKTIRKYSALIETEAISTKTEALIDAIIEFLKWMFLGLLSAISYVAWLILALAIANEKELKKKSFLGPLGFSILIFILGVIALENPNTNKVS